MYKVFFFHIKPPSPLLLPHSKTSFKSMLWTIPCFTRAKGQITQIGNFWFTSNVLAFFQIRHIRLYYMRMKIREPICQNVISVGVL